MALTISSVGNGVSTTNNTTLATGATVNASVGDVLLVCIAAANTGTAGAAPTVTIADNAGGSTNVYTQRGTTGNATAGTAGDGASQYFFECPVTTALSGATVTITFNVNVAQKAVEVYRIQPGTGEIVSYVSVGTAQNTTPNTGATSHAAATVSVTNGETIFAMAAVETDDAITGDSDTTNGSWSTVSTRLADGGADASTMSCVSQYKTVSATGNQSWAATTAIARDSSRNYIIYKPAAAPKILTANAGSHSLTGTAASLELGRKTSVSGGTYAVNGSTAGLNRGKTLALAAGSYATTGQDVSLERGFKVQADGGSYAITGTNATPELNRKISIDSGAYAIGGTNATLTYTAVQKNISANSGSFSISGTAALVERGFVLHAESAATGGGTFDSGIFDTGIFDSGEPVPGYSVSGSAATPVYGRVVFSGGGSYVLVGTNAALEHGREVLADGGAYSATGGDASLEFGREVLSDSGSYAITGTDASHELGRETLADGGTYAATGATASLEHGWVISADSGIYALTGTDAALTKAANKTLAVNAGSYSLAGQNSGLEVGREVQADGGSYIITGASATLYLPGETVLPVEGGEYTASGGVASLERGYVLRAFAGGTFDSGIFDSGIFDTGEGDNSYTITGAPAGLLYAPTEKTILASGGAYGVEGTSASLVYGEIVSEADGIFRQFRPAAARLPVRNAWLDVTEKPDTLEAYAGTVQFPDVVLPPVKPRKRRLPKIKAKTAYLEQRDSFSADAQWNLDPVLIDNDMMLLLAA